MIKLMENNEDNLGKSLKYAKEEVVKLGNKLISTHHDHIREANICLIMRSGSWKSRGRSILGKCHKVSEREKLVSGFDFIIILNEDAWHHMQEKQRLAVLDHELCHCDMEEDSHGNPVWKLATHDVEEFSAIVRRHGFYMQELEHFVECSHQMNIVNFNDKTAS